jgi:hypothetical protein
VSVHGHEDNDELRNQVRGMLEPAEAYQAEGREKEPMPS